jgi:hypothetical protein
LVPDLEDAARQIGKLVRTDPMRAVYLYDSFLAGCYRKADDCDDSDGGLAVFVGGLHLDDPYGFADGVDEQAMQVMDAVGFAAFERAAKARFLAVDRAKSNSRHAHNRGGGVLRTIYAQQRDVDAYVAFCEANGALGRGLLCHRRHA